MMVSEEIKKVRSLVAHIMEDVKVRWELGKVAKSDTIKIAMNSHIEAHEHSLRWIANLWPESLQQVDINIKEGTVTMGYEEQYLIESIEHTLPGKNKMWWAPNRLGYTDNVDKAGRYLKAEAEEICTKAGPDNERMWTEDQVYSGQAGRLGRVVIL